MRVTVCQLRTSPGALEQDWAGLVAHVAEQRSDVVVRPVDRPAGRRNEAYLATPSAPVRTLHDKSYLPGEPGFWEASWYGRGDGGHQVVEVSGLRVGVLVATPSRDQPWVTVEVDLAAVDAAKEGCPRSVPDL